MLTTGTGLLLIPMLRYYPFSAVLLIVWGCSSPSPFTPAWCCSFSINDAARRGNPRLLSRHKRRLGHDNVRYRNRSVHRKRMAFQIGNFHLRLRFRVVAASSARGFHGGARGAHCGTDGNGVRR
ncbi:hypothetical protein [Paraburkholderia aromaticivorans]|uniref:hypothetical protein n=1 Tax=Paraburkholderia aromaticivorans TaxID=2026199 RepID=UPI0023F72D93|nr:hypothetical protein [Paraburkholderia aromaticivorans]